MGNLSPPRQHLHDNFEAVVYVHWPCPIRSGLTVGLFYVEIERPSSHELQCTVRFFMFVYVYDVLCTRGDLTYLGDMIGK